MTVTTMGPVLDQLFQTITSRQGTDPSTSYTSALFQKGRRKIAQKVGEEGVEAALAAVANDHPELIKESADLFYHLFVLWADAGVKPADVLAELAQREGTSGLVEKAARPK